MKATIHWPRVAIVGVGLIGGSVGLALVSRRLAGRVIGIGRSAASLAEAKRRGTVTETTTDLAGGVLSDCRRGECGLCALQVLGVEGRVDHRDVFLSERQQAENQHYYYFDPPPGWDQHMPPQQQSMQQFSTASQAALDSYMGNTRMLVETLAVQKAITEAFEGDPKRAKERLQDYIKTNKDYWAIFLFDTKGVITLTGKLAKTEATPEAKTAAKEAAAAAEATATHAENVEAAAGLAETVDPAVAPASAAAISPATMAACIIPPSAHSPGLPRVT
jgi:hypothetical protein